MRDRTAEFLSPPPNFLDLETRIRGRIREIIEALNVLEHNPMIGRPAKNDKRELVIGRDSHGYVALYRYIAEIDTVFVLAVRSQQEAGYAGF